MKVSAVLPCWLFCVLGLADLYSVVLVANGFSRAQLKLVFGEKFDLYFINVHILHLVTYIYVYIYISLLLLYF